MAKVRILSGSEPATLIEKNITVNGTYNASADDADGYSSVNVNVSPILISKTITENGTYSAHNEPGAPDGYSSVNVNVQPNLYDPGTITSNGTYTVPAGYDGFTSFTVDIQPPTYDCVRVWTQSAGGSDASVNIQEGTYTDGVFTPTGQVQNLLYTRASSPVSYFNTLSIQYQSGWKMVALTDELLLNGVTYNTNDVMAQWQYNQTQNYYVLEP